MKNIVNRALVAKKKQFLSKAVPRGTRTIWRYLGALFLLFTFAIGNVWGADPQDTYYSFPDTKTTGQTVSPISGESNAITVGSNGVVASAFTFAGTEYTNGLKLGNTIAKGATLSIPGSTTNPAHVFIVCSGSNKDVYLELNSTKEATANVYSSTSPIPGVMELVVTKSGNYNLYASGDVFCYEIRILYEKNNNVVKTYQSGVGMSITSSSTWDSETEELLYFKPMEVTVDKTNKRYTFGGTATAPGRRTIKFTAYADGSLEVGAMCSNNSNRNLQLKKMNGASFSDALVTSSNIQKGATTTLEYASIEEGTTYVLVSSGSDMHVTSIVFTPDAPAATYNATFANGGHGTAPSDATGVSSVTLTEITGVDGWKNTGWTANKATKVGTTDKAAGATLNIGDVVTLLENTTFTAQWAQLYTVTYNKAAGEEGDVPTQVPLVDGSKFDVAGQGSLAPPTPGQVFRGWSDGIAAEPYKEGDEYTIAGANVNFTAVWGATTSYTITLDAKGGSVASYDTWTKDGDVYSKTLVEGTTVPLLAFTKAGLQLMFFRDGSANEFSGSVTLNSDMNLSAIWGEEKEVELYYWEGKEGGAIERGGTAVSVDKDGNPTAGNADVNASVSTYYTIRVQGKYDYSNPYVKITTDESVKTGDKITFTGFINKNQEKDAAMLMKAGDKVLFAETTSLPNIAYPVETPETPEEREYTISTTDVDATVLDLMRNNGHSGTNCFVTKIAITGTRVEEVKDPCETPTITAQPVGGTYNWNQDPSMSVTASVEDGGTLKYQWYKKGTPDAKVGTNSNAFTPTESGTYYVIVTNTKAGYGDADKKSDEVAVTINARPSYKVTYYDGATKLGEEDVLEDANPAEYEAKQAKAIYGISGLYTFNGWFYNSDLAEEHKIANIATLAISGVTNIYGKWTRIEAQDVDMVEYAATIAGEASTEEEFNAFKTWFTGKGYAYANLKELDNKAGNNGAYLGLKTKSDAAYIAFNVPTNKRVTIKLGSMAVAAEMYINGAKDETQALTGGSTGSGDNYADWHYDVTEASTLKLQMKTGNTCVVKAITIGEIPAQSDDATLSDLKVGGVTVDGFSASKLDYSVELPYGSTSQPEVVPTPNDANVTSVVIAQTLASLDDATITVTAQDGVHNKVYTVHFTVAPKLGVELIKATHTGTTTASKEGYWTADVTVDKKTQSKKMGANDDYFGLTLAGGKTFKNNDIVVIYLDPTQNPSAWLQLFKDKGTNMIADVQSGVKKGVNYITLAGLPEEGIDKLYLYRTSTAAGNMNPYVDYIAVYRLMAPFIESFEIEGIGALQIEGTNITASVANSFDVTALTPTVKFWANGGGSIDKTTAQDFTNPVQYKVSSAYAEDAPVTYTVTITKVVPSVEPTITTQPAGANYYEDATINALSVVAESTAGTLSYQWQVKEGLEYEDIDGATNASYTPAISAIGSYTYRVVVTNTEESKPSTSVISDDATIVIAEDPAAIKLIVDGTSGKEVNTTNYITGVAASKVTISSVEYDCVTFAGGVGEHVNSSNIKNLDRHISYNATTTQTKVKLSLYNSNGNNRTIYVKGVVEGSTEEEALATIQLAGNEQKTTEWIEFNNAKNRTIYIFVSGNAGDIKILQEKVIESGEPLKKAGQAGYSLNMNKGRMFGASSATIAFEGMTYTLNGDYTTLSSGVLKVKSNNIVFNVTVPTLLKVTTANDKTYYVGTAADATTNETAKSGVSEFDLTAGTWYINAGGSEVQFTNIAFEAPKCEKPTIVDMENIGLCEGDAFIALNVSASVTDGGTLHYQWYKHPAEGDDEEVGTDAASYTPTADGQYYVIVTNKLADHTDNAKTSNMVTVAHFASAAITTAPENQYKEVGQIATLTVEATGKAPLTYQWYTCDDEAGNNPVIIDGADEATYEVTVTAAMNQYYKVVVGSGCGEASAVALVAEWREVTPANVTGSITWDWAGSAWNGISGDIAFANTGVEQLMANVSSKVPVSDAGNFRADMLYGTGQYVWRSSNKFFQGTQIRFITEVPGFLTVHYRNTSGSTNTRKIEVVNNGETLAEDGTSTTNNWKWTNKVFVQAGEVILNGIASETNGLTRIDQIVFNATPDYSRSVSSNYGTLCVEHNVPAGQYFGATFYQIASRNEDYDYKIDFEEVLPNEELKAGEPYLFKSNTGKIELFFGETEAPEPVAVRGMIGNYDPSQLAITAENMNTIYYFAQNKLWLCDNLVDSYLILNEHRAYIDLTQVPTYEQYNALQQQNSAPRRRVSLEMNGEKIATGCENLNVSDKPVKMIINGQLFILRGEKMYDAKGQLVK